jgi:hypothetical protein
MGAALGTFLGSVILIPVFGLIVCCYFTSILLAGGIFLLIMI